MNDEVLMKLYETQCPKCGRLFYGKKENYWAIEFAFQEHVKYCNLTTKQKVLRIVLSPLAFVSIPTLMLGEGLWMILHPLGYPFVYALKLLVENEAISWDRYQRFAGMEPTVKQRNIRRG